LEREVSSYHNYIYFVAQEDNLICILLIKGTVHQKAITTINLYAPNVSAPNFIKHTLRDLKAHIHSNTVVVGDFSTLLSPIDRSSKQKINKEILELNDTINEMDLVDVYRIFHPKPTQYTFFSAWNFLQNRSYLRTQNKPQQI
jgi:exonuclease III